MAQNRSTPTDQGVPEIYLNPDNGNFLPGYDASLKRDLIASVLGLDNPRGLHEFTEDEAMTILEARGWTHFLDRKREIIAEKARRKVESAQRREEAKAERERLKAERQAAREAEQAAQADTDDDSDDDE